MWFLFMRWRTCSSASVELQDISCCTEINCETFRLTPAAPCSAIARTTSRSVNIPTAVLPSVRTTSLTTSALILLARISCAATPTVSFIRTVTTRAVFLRRTSPTFIATSLLVHPGKHSLAHTLVYIMPIVNQCLKNRREIDSIGDYCACRGRRRAGGEGKMGGKKFAPCIWYA